MTGQAADGSNLIVTVDGLFVHVPQVLAKLDFLGLFPADKFGGPLALLPDMPTLAEECTRSATGSRVFGMQPEGSTGEARLGMKARLDGIPEKCSNV